jgi:hypothetical protein
VVIAIRFEVVASRFVAMTKTTKVLRPMVYFLIKNVLYEHFNEIH